MGQDKNQESNGALINSEYHSTNKKTDSPCVVYKTEEKKHKCTYPECKKVFLRPSKLARHVLSHTGERPHKCNHPGCEKTYTNACHLKRHMESHNVTKTTYQCTHCSLSISNRHNLKRHYERVHGDRSKLTCKDCNVTFNKKHQLLEHLSTHSETVYKCDVCNKAFTNVKKFNRHEASHKDGSKTYPCTAPDCTEVFGKWQLFCTHMKTQHVTEYKCDSCDKVFSNKNHLKRHSQIHSKDRAVIACPYDDCPRVYLFKRNLNQHIQSSHIGKRFHCDICDIRLSTKKKLALHIERLHVCEKTTRQVKKVQRKTRKDVGIPKRSVVTALIGVNLPPAVEKRILQRENHIPYLEQLKEISDDN